MVEFKEADDVRQHMIDKQHSFMSKERLPEYASFYDFESEILDKAELQKQKFGEVTAGDKNVVKVDINQKEAILRVPKVLESGELLLPSGKIAGNKEYGVYYKQNVSHIAKKEEVKALALENRQGQYDSSMVAKSEEERAIELKKGIKQA